MFFANDDNLSADQQFKKYCDKLDKTWGKLTENHNGMPNIPNEHVRRQLTIMLDTTERMYKAGMANDANMTIGTTQVGVGGSGVMLPKILPPIMRRLIPSLITNELVQLQAMPVPDGKTFFLDFLDDDGNRIDLKQYFNKDYSNSAGEAADIKNLQLKMTSDTITAVAKKLKAQWTLELQQDMYAYLQMSVESETIAAIATQIKMELEGQMISLLYSSASAGNVNWYTVPPSADTKTIDIEAYNKTLYNAICDADNEIFKKRFINASWLIADADICNRLEKLQNFVVDPAEAANRKVMGRRVLGTLAGKYTIYKDPFFAPSKILLGFMNHDNVHHTGAVLATYVPAYLTGTFENPAKMDFVKGFMTRNAMKVYISDMYATVTIVEGQNPAS